MSLPRRNNGKEVIQCLTSWWRVGFRPTRLWSRPAGSDDGAETSDQQDFRVKPPYVLKSRRRIDGGSSLFAPRLRTHGATRAARRMSVASWVESSLVVLAQLRSEALREVDALRRRLDWSWWPSMGAGRARARGSATLWPRTTPRSPQSGRQLRLRPRQAPRRAVAARGRRLRQDRRRPSARGNTPAIARTGGPPAELGGGFQLIRLAAGLNRDGTGARRGSCWRGRAARRGAPGPGDAARSGARARAPARRV